MSPALGAYAIGALAAAGAATLGLSLWPPGAESFEFGGLLAAAVLSSTLDERRWTDAATMPLSFVISLAALLLLGPLASTLVALAGALAVGLHAPWRKVLARIAGAVATTQAAGLAYTTLGGAPGRLEWPWQGLPIAAAVLVYCFVVCASSEILVPMLTRKPCTNRSCFRHILTGLPNYVLGASVAVAIAEAIDHQMWGLVPVALVPLHLTYRSYCAHLDRLQQERRRRALIESHDQGMCIVDGSGRLTLWNEALASMLNCPRELAMGQSIVGAVPALARIGFPRVLQEAISQKRSQTFDGIRVPSGGGWRLFEIKLVPDAGGTTLLWHDVTERSQAQIALKRTEERFALMERGANDGLWEWDIRNHEMYVSGRWRALVGLSPDSQCWRPEDWLDRVHADDVAPLKQAIAEHLAGESAELQHEHRIRHEDGTYRHVVCRGVAVRGASRRAMRIAGSLTDVTDRARSVVPDGAGYRDPLTGLSNRAVFVEALERRLQQFKQRRCGRFALLYLDLDRFKVVNDSLGHLVGDELLIAVARRIESCLREGDAFARLGGDEFTLLLSELDDEGQANAVAFRIQDSLAASFSIGGREVYSSASIGIAFCSHDYTNAEEIMRDADAAMYHAKSRGRSRHEMFDAAMHARALDRLGLESDLRHAVKSSEFELHYQPIVSLVTGACAGFEALVRWNRNNQVVPPDKFVPVAEELGLIVPLGTWVLQEACRTFADWQRRFPDAALECITVNVSTRQLLQPNFMNLVEQAVRQARLKPSELRLEITETTLMDNPYTTAEMLHELRKFGVKIYLDDFGTGYSSLSHLHKLPVDALKIDRSFVRSLLLDERPAIVESILALARTLDTGVVAEGVESDMQATELARLGCRHAQGFHFSPPLCRDGVEELLRSNRRLGQADVESASDEPKTYYSSRPFQWPDAAAIEEVAV